MADSMSCSTVIPESFAEQQRKTPLKFGWILYGTVRNNVDSPWNVPYISIVLCQHINFLKFNTSGCVPTHIQVLCTHTILCNRFEKEGETKKKRKLFPFENFEHTIHFIKTLKYFVFSEFIYSTVKHVDIQNNHIQTVDDETFQGLRLESLKITANKIHHMSDRSLRYEIYCTQRWLEIYIYSKSQIPILKSDFPPPYLSMTGRFVK